MRAALDVRPECRGRSSSSARTDLADVLEHRNRLLEVADVEDGEDELDVGVVA